MRTIVIIVGAGLGSRFGCIKQYELLCEREVIYWAIEAFYSHSEVDLIIPVIRAQDQGVFSAIAKLFGDKLAAYVIGGATRDESVMLGIAAASSYAPKIALIHDAVRPLVSEAIISRVIKSVEPGIGVMPAIGVFDAVKISNDCGYSVSATIDRSTVFLAQTPQGFCFSDLISACRIVGNACVDDAERFEKCGKTMLIVPGDPMNFKITVAQDMLLAESLMMRLNKKITA